MVRALARGLVAAPFIADSIEAIRFPAAHVSSAKALASREIIAGRIPDLSESKWKLVVRGHGAATIRAALTMASGKATRLSAAALVALTLPRLATRPNGSPADRDETFRILGAIGAALAIASDRKGKPSRQWLREQAKSQAEAD